MELGLGIYIYKAPQIMLKVSRLKAMGEREQAGLMKDVPFQLGRILLVKRARRELLGRKQAAVQAARWGSGAYTGSSQFSSAVLFGASGEGAWSKHGAGPDASRRSKLSLNWRDSVNNCYSISVP